MVFQDQKQSLDGLSEGHLRSLIVMLVTILATFPAAATAPYVCSAILAIGREASECQNADVELYDMFAEDWNYLVCGGHAFTLPAHGITYHFSHDVNGSMKTSIGLINCIWDIYQRP